MPFPSSEQKQIIHEFSLDSNRLVLGIPGCGKSRVIGALISKCLNELKLLPAQLFIATFTNTAAERLINDFRVPLPYCGTFHGTAQHILAKYGLLNQTDPLHNPDLVLMQFVRFLQSDSKESIEFKQSLRHGFIDEFQDDNSLMATVAKLLRPYIKFTAVGDDFQNLMSFIGSDIRHIREFPTLFLPCKIYYLSVNFRCSTPIVELANCVMDSGDMSQYLPKPRGKSVEMLQWQEEKIQPSMQQSKDVKPRLRHCNSDKEAVELSCQDIHERIQANPQLLQERVICIQARTNQLLNRARTALAKRKIPSMRLRDATRLQKIITKRKRKDRHKNVMPEDEEEKEEKQIRHGNVILTTPFSGKGEEFDDGYILVLHNTLWPDYREPDLEKERRVLFTAITRYKKDVVIYNVLAKTSLFLLELQRRQLLSSLFQSSLISKVPENTLREQKVVANIVEDSDEEKEGDDRRDQEAQREGVTREVRRFLAWSAQCLDKRNLFMFPQQWVSRLNGCAQNTVKTTILPQPFRLLILPVPILYSIEPPALVAVEDPAEIELSCSSSSSSSESGSSSSDDDDGAEPLHYPEELDLGEDWFQDVQSGEIAQEEIEYHEPHVHIREVKMSCTTDEIESFLQCWTLRWMQEMQCKYSGAELEEYSFYPAEHNFRLRKQHGIELTDQQSKFLNTHYKIFRGKDNTWQTCLIPIYWTSTFAGLFNDNLGMLYSPMYRRILLEYKFMLEEIGSTLHYLIYAFKFSAYNGKTCPDWKVETFFDLPGVQKPQPYVLLGDRLLMWTMRKGESEAFDQNIVFETIAYACLLNLTQDNQRKVKMVHIYDAFARKICTVKMDTWSLEKQAHYLNFMRKAKRSIFEGYE